MHPQLIKSGLLKYVAQQKQQGNERLWPNVYSTKNGQWSDATSKWYGKLNRAYITENKKKVFHSFRHTFITNLIEHKVPVEIVETLDGHKPKNASIATDVYNKYRKPIKELAHTQGIVVSRRLRKVK